MARLKQMTLILFLVLNTNTWACDWQSTVWNDILECSMNNHKYHQDKLNQVYQITLNQLPKKEKAILEKSQEQWQKTIENECMQFANQELYGREGAFDVIQCDIDEMQKRIIFLENYVKR